ncbi:FkbM family methyltransferase [Hansschlegelia zhihuaiae]|uniref:FkbM family methyltransferase n=1 Tax=Hansschlegelia zhihuaiae TaxID=405005 RepID=A0A4Q0MKL9_9HYPH|nr:FkbM family methyltransferase [Hansschlegelia zhihuaiae]RXF74317.1 FkbM family methyltransferase [Hansschlegelia zhihuaiae]
MSVVDHASLLRRLSENGWELNVLYDVGANIGRWSIEAQRVLPGARFELFEPLVGRYKPVDDAVRFSQIRDYGLHPVALSDENKTDNIKLLGNMGVGSSILLLDADRRKDIPLIECDYARMDDIVAAKGLRAPDFIKLDTQASELRILKGAVETLKKNKFVLVETWMRRSYGPETPLFHELANFMYEQDYILYEIILSEGRDPDGTLRWFDAVFQNKAFSRFDAAQL